jgi:hypothetical protein
MVSLLITGFLLAAPAMAQEAVGQAPSLRAVPGDAASYSVLLRNREQLEAILNSKAWERLSNMPVVQLGRNLLESQWNDPNSALAALKNWYDQADNAELVRFLGELFEEEVFTFTGKGSPQLTALFQQVQAANQFAPLTRLLQGNFNAANANDPLAGAKAMLQTLSEHADKLQVPDVVLGFRLSRTKPAQAARHLEHLEKLLIQAWPDAPQHLKKTKIHGATFRTLVLDGSMIPWDRIPMQMLEDTPGQYDKLVKRLKEMKLTIALGVEGNYVLLGLGEGTAGLQSYGDSLPNRLSARSELAMLSKAAGRRLTSITYTSQAAQRTMAGAYSLEGMAAQMKTALQQAGLSAEKREKIKRAFEDLAADLKKHMPEPGAQLSFSYLSGQGYEGYAYDWSRNAGRDSSRPLALLRHVGEHPLAFYVARGQSSVKDYENLVRLLTAAYQGFEEVLLPKLPEEARMPYEQFMTGARPLLARLDKATAKMLLPALGDESGFVLDAHLKSKQWQQALPPSDKDLPMLEPALLLSVRDPELLVRAGHEYRQVFNELMVLIARQTSGKFPEIRIPAPKVTKTEKGKLYSWPLPESLGLDQQLQPTAALSDKVAVLTLSHHHARRMLTPTSPKVAGPLKDVNRPLASAGLFRWAGLMDALAPWAEYGLTLAGQGSGDVHDQVMTVLDVLKVLRSYTSATYVEGDTVVTHSHTVIRDVAK